MKKALLFVVALSAISASIAQAADRLQISTVLTLDGKAIEHRTGYIDNGETVHYLSDHTLEVMKAKDQKVKIEDNEKRAVGLEAHLTARLNSEGKILLTSKASYVGFYGYQDSPIPGVKNAEFWTRELSGTRTIKLGEPARYYDARPLKDKHDAFITVTVTRI